MNADRGSAGPGIEPGGRCAPLFGRFVLCRAAGGMRPRRPNVNRGADKAYQRSSAFICVHPCLISKPVRTDSSSGPSRHADAGRHRRLGMNKQGMDGGPAPAMTKLAIVTPPAQRQTSFSVAHFSSSVLKYLPKNETPNPIQPNAIASKGTTHANL
nr:hypothetical protein [uncultured Rhodopila sp.]